jgi:hypothetical protein
MARGKLRPASPDPTIATLLFASGWVIFAVMTRDRIAMAGYTYAQVDAALCALFHVPVSARGSFRGRVRHLQRIGLVDVAPGKGCRIAYTLFQANEWMLALLLAQLGVDPVVIVKSVKRERKKLHESFREATDDDALGGNEVFLATRPELMSGTWARRDAAGILRFAKFRRRDPALKIPRHLHPPPSGRLALKATAPSSQPPPALTQPGRSAHRLSAENLTAGPPVLGSPELGERRFLDWVDPLLLVINLTGPVRALEEALRAAASASLTEAKQMPPWGLALRARRGVK